jgi:hypothetical protein
MATPEQEERWDFFLAHAGADVAAAEELFDELRPHCRVFLDSRCLLPGDDWDRELAAAQAASRVSVVLLSENTDDAYYQREEIAAALEMARRNASAHRVVPLYLSDPRAAGGAMPYGLRLKQGLMATEPGSLAEAARRLVALLARLQDAPIGRQRVEASVRGLTRLTAGSANDRLEGLKEITRVFRPLIVSLVAVLVIVVLLMGACVLAPGLETTIDRQLAVLVLATISAFVLASLMVLFLKSVNLARAIVHTGAVQ